MPAFRHPLRVRYHECDQQGLVFNANHLTYWDIAMTEFWREAMGGYQALPAAGIEFVVAEATIRYRAPLRFDELCEVSIDVAQVGTSSVNFAMAIDRDGTRVSEGTLRYVAVNADGLSEVVPMPGPVRAALGA